MKWLSSTDNGMTNNVSTMSVTNVGIYDMAFPAAVSTDTYLSEPTSKMSVT